MPSKSPAQTLLEKADKKANASTGWFSSSSTKFEEAGDLYQQAANSFKLEKLFREAGDAFAKEAECREKCKETNDAANAWWNAAKAYKRGFPDRALIDYHCHYIAQDSLASSRNPSVVTNSHTFNSSRSLPPGC
jgi:alpha-soluble NSF attachment protein